MGHQKYHTKIHKHRIEARQRDKQICSIIQLLILPVVLIAAFWDYFAYRLTDGFFRGQEGLGIGQFFVALFFLLIIGALEQIKKEG